MTRYSKSPEMVAARLAAIIESSYDAIVAKDLHSIITDWNPAAERMFGYTAEEAVGRPITMLIPEHLQDQETEIISRIKAKERVESFETIRKRKNGELIHVSLTISPILDSAGNVVGASKIARDITQAKESERRIRLLLREINHRVKNQYAVILSLIRETGLRSQDMEDFQRKVRQRIEGLAASHDLLVRTDWSGSILAEVVGEQLLPFGGEGQVTISGPLIRAGANAVQNIGMAIHELGTNSAKYGVLSGVPGTIVASWTVEAGELHFAWREAFEVPLAMPGTTTSGFGSVVLKRVVPLALGGTVVLDRTPDGVTWSLVAPVSAIVSEASSIAA